MILEGENLLAPVLHTESLYSTLEILLVKTGGESLQGKGNK